MYTHARYYFILIRLEQREKKMLTTYYHVKILFCVSTFWDVLTLVHDVMLEFKNLYEKK